MKKNIIIVLGEPNSISSEIFLKSINYIKKTKSNFIIIGNYSLLKKQLITTEQNKLLNKFSATHLEKSKKKYLIKFL